MYATLEEAWGAPWEPETVVDPPDLRVDHHAGKRMSREDILLALEDLYVREGRGSVEELLPFDIHTQVVQQRDATLTVVLAIVFIVLVL